MSTEYIVLKPAHGPSTVLVEQSGLANFRIISKGLTADDLSLMAVEMLKVASYLDPEAIKRTAQHLGEKEDWDYYAGVIRELL